MSIKSKKSKKSKTNSKSLILNKNIRLGIIVFAITALAGASYLLLITINNKFVERRFPAYSYSNSAKVDYSVSLIPNTLYTEKTVGEGKVYIAEYIENINTKLNYQFSGEKSAEVSGKYSVVAIIDGLLVGERENKTVWSKEYVLQPETRFSGNDKIVSIEKDIPINLSSYNSFVQQIMESTKINFDNTLTIKWNISMEAKTDKGEIKEQLTPTMEIPLNNKFFEIGGNLNQEKKGAIEETIKVVSPLYQKKVVLCYAGIGICLAALLFILIFTGSGTAADPMEKQLKQIFKLHGDRLVALNSELAVTSEGVIQVTSIDDLVRISDDIGKPILYTKGNRSRGINSFYVIDESLIYLLNLERREDRTIIMDNSSSESSGAEA